jgi:predicted AAA+ superfamily ATPase
MRIKRNAEKALLELSKGFPIVAVTGPRQSGKTTLVKNLFSDKPYLSLEDLDKRQWAIEDPRSFLKQFPDGAVLDEAQQAPDLFSYLQTLVDNDGRMGLFVLTGSQQFGLLSNISQSLAGRVAFVNLLPFSLDELQATQQAPSDLDALLFQGLYPPIYDRSLNPINWYEGYIATYLERDVRQLINIQNMTAFQRFIRLCAGYTGQLVNLSGMANDCGITHTTARNWLSVLQASYLVHLLQPHHRNFNKRLVKTPKLYFYDTGLACRLMSLQNAEQIKTHPQRGALFETFVVNELLKARLHQALPDNLFFWRDQSGTEVDVLIDQGNRLDPVEIKSGQTITPDFFKGLKRWRDLAQDETGPAWLVYGGDVSQERQDVRILSWQDLTTMKPQLE